MGLARHARFTAEAAGRPSIPAVAESYALRATGSGAASADARRKGIASLAAAFGTAASTSLAQTGFGADTGRETSAKRGFTGTA